MVNRPGPVIRAFRDYFDAVVDVDGKVGGQYTVIQDADDDLDSGNYSLLIKTGTYAAGFTVSTDNAYVFVEPGTVIQAAVTLSGNDVTLVLGAGCDIQASVALSGANCSLICLNGCDLDGVTMSGNFGYFSGGGWETLVNGGTSNHGIAVTATDCVVENTAVQTTAGGGASYDGVYANGVRTTLQKIKVVDSDDDGIVCPAADILVTGCIILGADDQGVYVDAPRCRLIGNHIIATGGDGIHVTEWGDDTVIVGNIIQDSTGDSVELAANGNNCVVVANRLDGAVTDGSTGSTVGSNDVTAF